MTFGEEVRGAARKGKNFDLRTLAGVVGVHFTYLSKVENGKLDFGDAPKDGLILKLAAALDADELLLRPHWIPERIRKRVLQPPDAFRRLAALDDDALDKVLAGMIQQVTAGARTRERALDRNAARQNHKVPRGKQTSHESASPGWRRRSP